MGRKERSPRTNFASPHVYNWIIQVQGFTEVRYLRFVDGKNYTMITDHKMAHTITGSAAFARGFCQALNLSIGGTFKPIIKPVTKRHEYQHSNQ